MAAPYNITVYWIIDFRFYHYRDISKNNIHIVKATSFLAAPNIVHL